MGQAAGERTPDTLFLRVVSAVVLVTVAVGATWFGAPAFDIFVALFAMAMIWEWAGMCGIRLNSLTGWLLGLGVLFVILFAALERYEGTVIAGLASMLLLAGLGGRREKRWAVAGVLYLGIPCLALVSLRQHPESGLVYVLALFVIVWANDIGGYVFGRMIGGARLAPKISPNKTWAGVVGGLGCGIAAAAAMATVTGGMPVVLTALLALVIGAASQAGDLFESWMKRRFEVKDSGRLIPGHGGVLDRVDGLLAAAPLAAILTVAARGGN